MWILSRQCSKNEDRRKMGSTPICDVNKLTVLMEQTCINSFMHWHTKPVDKVQLPLASPSLCCREPLLLSVPARNDCHNTDSNEQGAWALFCIVGDQNTPPPNQSASLAQGHFVLIVLRNWRHGRSSSRGAALLWGQLTPLQELPWQDSSVSGYQVLGLET
jgi:hypothetical protein